MSFTLAFNNLSVVLPNAVPGNTVSADIGLVTKVSRLGTQHQWYNNNRHEIRLKQYSFVAVREETIVSLRAFLVNTLGQEIFITDHDGQYTGVIDTEGLEIVTSKDICSYSISLTVIVKVGVELDVLVTQDGIEITTQDGQQILIQELV